MTETEKIEKRRAYQREYYKNYRKGKKALEYACNIEQAKKDRENRQKLLQKIACCLLVAVCLMCFSACDNEPRILYQSESVEVVREGNITLVSDLVADKEYSFRSVRVKRSESVLEPHTAIETDTIKIEIIPSGLRVYDKTANKIFTYQRKSLHNKG
jgi:hypothetical protein